MSPKSEKGEIAVIAGSGMSDKFSIKSSSRVRTKFGTVMVYRVYSKAEFLFLPRHGIKHTIPPHMINYRANILALFNLGVRKIIATSAVGSMREDLGVGELGLIEQFIDMTKKRKDTFFDNEVIHTDLTRPYDRELNRAISEAAKKLGIRLSDGLVYICSEGPRYETPAEIRMYKILGGDVVGMTQCPEVILANELGIKYSCIAIVTNMAAGMQERISHKEVISVMNKRAEDVKRLIEETINAI